MTPEEQIEERAKRCYRLVYADCLEDVFPWDGETADDGPEKDTWRSLARQTYAWQKEAALLYGAQADDGSFDWKAHIEENYSGLLPEGA